MHRPETATVPGSVVASGQARSQSYMPSAANQAAFFATGAFAGSCTLPVELAWYLRVYFKVHQILT